MIRFLEWLERRLYAAATWIVTVGNGYRDQLLERGVAPERITVIPSGVDCRVFEPREDDGKIRGEYDLGDRFVCAYVGTIGMASGLGVALRAADRLEQEGRDDVRFLLVGDGAVREDLEAEARAGKLRSVVFTGRQAKSRMPEFLAATDACLVHLSRKDLFKTVLPSKIFEAAAMRKPIVLGVQGFAAELVSEAGAGLCIEPENEVELGEAVTRLARDRALGERLGAAGYERIAKRFDYDALAAEYLTSLKGHVAAAGGLR